MQVEQKGKFTVTVVPEEKKNDDIKQSFWRINKEMFPLKLHFFLFIGGMSAVLPYNSAIGITRYGLTASNLAAAFSSQQFLFLFFKPAIGYLADYFNKLKATIIGLTIIQAFCCICMILIPANDNRNNLGKHESQFTSSLEELKKCHLCNHYQEYNEILSNLSFDEDILKQGIYCLKHSDNKLTITAINCLHDNKSFSSISINFQIIFATCNVSSDLDILSPSYPDSSSLHIKQFFFINLSVNDTRISNIICSYAGYDNSNSSESKYDLNVMKHHCFSVSGTESVTIENIFTKLSFSSQTLNCKNFKSNVVQQRKEEHNIALSSANFKTYQFWLFTICLISACISTSCIFTMSDTVCHEIAHKTGNDYGRQRLWGAVSWGIIAPFAGFLNDYTDGYFAAWCLMVVLCSLQIWNLLRMNLIKPDVSQNFRKDLKLVFSSKEFIAFEIGVFMNGVFTGIIWFYLTWFITVIGGSRLQIGLAHTVECFLGEMPFMFFSSWFIKKFGHFNLVSLAIFTHGVRFVCYSYLRNAWWILPIECMHGLTFGVFYSAMTSYAKLNAKPGTEATTQSVLCTTYEALGAGVGCIVFGIYVDRYGAQKTFLYSAFFCALATCINMLSTFVIKCRKGDQEDSKITGANAERY